MSPRAALALLLSGVIASCAAGPEQTTPRGSALSGNRARPAPSTNAAGKRALTDPRICNLADVAVSADGRPITASDTTILEASSGHAVDIVASVVPHANRYSVDYLRLNLLSRGVSAYPNEGSPTGGNLLDDTLPTVEKVTVHPSSPSTTAVATLTIPGSATLSAGAYQVALVVRTLPGPTCGSINPSFVWTVVATVHWIS
jgi:hypothetical protein